MNIIFWGTPGFSVPALTTLAASRHNVSAVVTVPDKVQGRGLKPAASAVKEAALNLSIPVLQPESLLDPLFLEDLRSYSADLYVVIAFRILPKEIFSLPPAGSFNLHASLLPKYRGAAPIQWALINNEQITGATTFKLAEKVDTGNMYLQRAIPITPEDNAGTLHDRLSTLGAELILETVDLIESGSFTLLAQDNALASPAPKISKEICRLNLAEPAEKLHHLIRGLSPHPAAWFSYKGTQIKLFSTIAHPARQLPEGELIAENGALFLGCGSGCLQILELQVQGRKRLPVKEFLIGFRP